MSIGSTGKSFDFVGRKKIFIGISLGIILIGIICTLIFGVELDISFKGGTLLKYSYSGTLDADEVQNFASEKMNITVDDVQVTEDTLSLSMNEQLTLEERTELDDALLEKYAAQSLKNIAANSVNPTMGGWFLVKCLVAVALACVFLMIYVAFRFRKIGGFTAGVMALVALLNDLLVAFFSFVIFRIPLNDNFVAVLLSILGYSLNGTIVIYDRIRENRRLMDSKTSIADVVNLSVNQSFTRCFNTALCTFVSIAVVAIMALALRMDSIVSFAVPMMMGILSGFYTSTFLCSPAWVAWEEHRQKKALLRKEAEKAAPKTAKKTK